MNRSRLPLLIVLLIGFGVAYWFWPSDDRALVQRQLKKLGELASFPADEHPIRKQRAIGQMKDLFTPDLVLQLNLQKGQPHTIEGRKEFMERVQEVRFAVSAIQVDFEVTSVELSPDHRSATALTTLSAKIGAENQQEYQEMKVILEKRSEGWLIKRLETIKTYGR